MMIANVYDNGISWAFASKDKLQVLAQLYDGDSIVNDGGSIVYADDNDTMMDVLLTLTNLISYFKGVRLWYNDGSGTRDVVTFIGADLFMIMTCKLNAKSSFAMIWLFLWIQKL
jgi:hypothetical protein